MAQKQFKSQGSRCSLGRAPGPSGSVAGERRLALWGLRWSGSHLCCNCSFVTMHVLRTRRVSKYGTQGSAQWAAPRAT
eukprot:166495-Amphidinium_carterae.1